MDRKAKGFRFDDDELVAKLGGISKNSYEVLGRTLFVGAGIVADEIRKRCPEILKPSIQIARFTRKYGAVDTAVIFAGYSDHKTKQFPNGVPYALIAAAYESGTSEKRETKKGYNRGEFTKHPFIRPAVRAADARAHSAMQDKLNEEIMNYMEG